MELIKEITFAIRKMVLISLMLSAPALVVGNALVTDLDWGTAQEAMDIRPNAKGSPAAVIAKHETECWTGEQAPLADLPGSAVVQFMNGRTVRTHKHEFVDSAFKESLSASGYLVPKFDDKRIRTYALCL